MKVALLLIALCAVAAGQQCSSIYGQCGGKQWTGPTCCVAGSSCQLNNEWYSQCLPMPATSGQPTTGGTPTTKSTTGGQPTTGGTPTTKPTTGGGGTGTGTTAPAPTGGNQNNNPTNPYAGYNVFPSPFYAEEAIAASKLIADPVDAARALTVATIPSFTWLDTVSKIPVLEQLLSNAQGLQNRTGQKQLVQIVVYDLPNRDCAARASNGEFRIDQDGVNKYKAYIDRIYGTVMRYPDLRVVAIVEPDSLANLVTNLNMPTCAAAAEAYKTCTAYAIQRLSKAKIVQYLDAGHGGWLGWEPNLAPAAKVFGDVLRSVTGEHTVRGLVTNVANYNPLTIATPEHYTQGNKNYDELHFIQALAPLLTAQGFPAHFIVDQGRSGQTGIRNQWGDWCNIKGAGFGMRPTATTGYDILDAVVWTKPGGESDGTSNTSSSRFDGTCALSDSLQPAPEAGNWFQAYFEQLIARANPPIQPQTA